MEAVPFSYCLSDLGDIKLDKGRTVRCFRISLRDILPLIGKGGSPAGNRK